MPEKKKAKKVKLLRAKSESRGRRRTLWVMKREGPSRLLRRFWCQNLLVVD